MTSRERNAVHEVIRFQHRIKVENSAPSAWEVDWGFLKSEQALQKEQEINEFNGDKAIEPLGLPSDGSAPFFERARLWKRMEPKTKFTRPVLTSHEIGWRPSIDLFGPNQFGIHKNPDLFPSDNTIRGVKHH